MKKLISCDLCKSKQSSFQFLFTDYDRRFRIKGKYSLFQCSSCGLIFINPQPSEEEISKHYPAFYCSFSEKKPPRLLTSLYKTYYSGDRNWFFKLLFSPIKSFYLRSIKVIPKGKLLDVGCGSGKFLLITRLLGMDCYGVEPGDFDFTFAHENNLKIFHGALKNAHYPADFFDVITLNHVFEHVNNPTETLMELHRILKPNGTLVIAVPQSQSLAYLIFGRYWAQLDVPRHLFTYSVKTLKQYFQKTGFHTIKVRYNSNPYQFLYSFLYLFDIFKKKPIYLSEPKYLSKTNFILNNLFFLLLSPIAHLCNIFKIGDQVELILTKKVIKNSHKFESLSDKN